MGARLLATTFLILGMLLPYPVAAATFQSGRTVVVSEPTTNNAYVSGTDITLAAPLIGDLLGAGGTLRVAAPITGDALLAGGHVSVERPVEGDVRAAGARVDVTAPVTGDLTIAGGQVYASSTARDTRIAGVDVGVSNAGGKVVVYGATVTLSGVIQGDVDVVASDRLTLAEGTVIQGTLRYNAPQEALIPSTATIMGGATYTGAATYLPTTEEAQRFAVAGASVFILTNLIMLAIAAALVAGLFPLFSDRVADRLLSHSPGRFVLLALLGFAVVFAAPVLILILLVSIVGAGIALPLLFAYGLLLMLGYLYAGVVAGAALGRGLLKRPRISWKLAILGMIVLYIVGKVPVLGGIVVAVLFLAATGAIVAIAYQFAFGVFSSKELVA